MQLLVDNVGAALTVAADNAHAVVAEWLRRLTRNQIPSGSVGSNPTNCVLICVLNCVLISIFQFLL